MKRELHVRFCERPVVKPRRPTRQDFCFDLLHCCLLIRAHKFLSHTLSVVAFTLFGFVLTAMISAMLSRLTALPCSLPQRHSQTCHA
jgi:hypothetical protein